MKIYYVLALLGAFAVIDATFFDGEYLKAAHEEIAYLLSGY